MAAMYLMQRIFRFSDYAIRLVIYHAKSGLWRGALTPVVLPIVPTLVVFMLQTGVQCTIDGTPMVSVVPLVPSIVWFRCHC